MTDDKKIVIIGDGGIGLTQDAMREKLVKLGIEDRVVLVDTQEDLDKLGLEDYEIADFSTPPPSQPELPADFLNMAMRMQPEFAQYNPYKSKFRDTKKAVNPKAKKKKRKASKKARRRNRR
jgi:hypothetical protein